MTARRSILSALSILITATCLSGCVAAGNTSKTAQPNSSGDVAQSESPSAQSEKQSVGVAQESGVFSQPPPGETIARGERGPSAAPTPAPASPSDARQSTPSSGAPGRSMAAPSHAPVASMDESTTTGRYRSGGSVAKAAPKPSIERPGLATLWGETRESPVSTTSFTRSSNEPWSVLRIQYDDEAGILSRAGLTSTYSLGPNLIEAPNGMVTVQVIGGEGVPLAGITQGSRAFVVGRSSDRYGIRITNHTTERFEVVATVDGLDVLDGRPGSFMKRGYLLDAFSSVDIDGFRRSTTEVAAFRFGAVKDSYAARTSGDRNVGVIGVAVFREYHPVDHARIEENHRRDEADPFPRRFAAPPPTAPVIRD